MTTTPSLTGEEIVREMERKAIVPGVEECCFQHTFVGSSVAVPCESLADGVVVHHRQSRDGSVRSVVMPGCTRHRMVYVDESHYQVLSFDALRHEGVLS